MSTHDTQGPQSAGGATVRPRTGKPEVNESTLASTSIPAETDQESRFMPIEPLSSKQVKLLLLGIVVGALAIGIVVGVVTLGGIDGVVSGVVAAAVITWATYVFGLQRRVRATDERPIPTMGLPRLEYRLCRLLGIKYVPQRSLHEQIIIEQAGLRRLSDTTDCEIVVFGARGGVGKGTTASTMAVLDAETTLAELLVSDSRQKRGNIAERFGFDRRPAGANLFDVNPLATPTIRQIIETHKAGLFVVTRQAFRIIRTFPGTTLGVIASDRTLGRQIDFSVADFRAVMDVLRRIYRRMYHEVDNEFSRDLDLELMRRCDVPVFVTRVNHPYSNTELDDILTGYRGDSLETNQKIKDRGILVVLATKKGHTVAEFAEMFGFSPEQVFLVPYDSYFLTEEELRKHAEIDDKLATAVDTTMLSGSQMTENVRRIKPIVNTKKMSDEAKLVFLKALTRAFRSVQELNVSPLIIGSAVLEPQASNLRSVPVPTTATVTTAEPPSTTQLQSGSTHQAS